MVNPVWLLFQGKQTEQQLLVGDQSFEKPTSVNVTNQNLKSQERGHHVELVVQFELGMKEANTRTHEQLGK